MSAGSPPKSNVDEPVNDPAQTPTPDPSPSPTSPGSSLPPFPDESAVQAAADPGDSATESPQLITVPPNLDPRVPIGIMKLVMGGEVLAKPHTAAMFALTLAAWAADNMLHDCPDAVPMPRPGPIATLSSDQIDLDEVQGILALNNVARYAHVSEHAGQPGVQSALPPVDWGKVIQVIVVILQQVVPLFVKETV